MKRVILVIVALSIFFSTIALPTYAEDQSKRYLNIGANPQRPEGFKDEDIPPGWFKYTSETDMEVTTQDRNGKWTTGLVPKGLVMIAKVVSEVPTDDGCVIRTYLFGWIKKCGNKVEPVYVRKTLKMKGLVIIEVIKTEQQIIKEVVYRDRIVEKISYLYVPITTREITYVETTTYRDRFLVMDTGELVQQPASTKVAMAAESKSTWYEPPPIWNPNFYVFDVDNSNSNTATGGVGEAAAAAAAAASSSSSSSSTSTTPTSGAGAGGSTSGGSGAATSSP